MSNEVSRVDVVVVGGGNAAMCAAISAREQGASVVLLERAPYDDRGGNTGFTGGTMRVPFAGADDLAKLMPDMSQSELDNCVFGSYSEAEFMQDLPRVTDYRADPDLAEVLVKKSRDTLAWLVSHGVKYLPGYGLHSFEKDGKRHFWGNYPLEVSGGGRGLVDFLTTATEKAGVDIRYGTRVTSLLMDGPRVRGVLTRSGGVDREIEAGSVVLGCGGFQANPEMRAKYLGPGWELAKVRGTRFNTGDGLRMALDIGAASIGNWSGCHSVGWDLNAPECGDPKLGQAFSKHYYFLGIMVNSRGERFVDEGADTRAYTYAKYGVVILNQPSQFAWQIFDAKTAPLLQKEYYRQGRVTRVAADTLEELVTKLEGVDPKKCLETIAEFNKAVDTSNEFDPSTKDGRRTNGLAIEKTNWANTIDEGPFEAFGVTCGITFTYGGLRITTGGEVLDTDGQTIPGLYACGEIVGGLFYFNYPGGSGLTWGSVMGRISGQGAAETARQMVSQ